MRTLILAFLLSISSCSAATNEAERALEQARQLAKEGDYEGALAKHIWFHDNALSIDPSYRGVRLSFALTDWVKLGRKYPKALEKLRSIRDEKTSRLSTGETNRELFADVNAINRYLGESKATVDLFKKIDADNPKFAASIYRRAEESLFQSREYALAKKYIGDPEKHFATAKETFESGMNFAKTSVQEDASRQAFERIFTGDIVRLVTILNETGDPISAKEIQTKALKILDNEAIRNALKN